MGKLVVLDGVDQGKIYLLRARNIVGRHSECSLVVNDKGVSGNHCKIEQVNQRDYLITDLNSSNGTYLNGKKINSEKINFGDIITLGKTRVIFQPVERSFDDSTTMVDVSKYVKEYVQLMHCDKPVAREWTFCPYCGLKLMHKND